MAELSLAFPNSECQKYFGEELLELSCPVAAQKSPSIQMDGSQPWLPLPWAVVEVSGFV